MDVRDSDLEPGLNRKTMLVVKAVVLAVSGATMSFATWLALKHVVAFWHLADLGSIPVDCVIASAILMSTVIAILCGRFMLRILRQRF